MISEIVITENWLHDENEDSELSNVNFVRYRKDRLKRVKIGIKWTLSKIN